jgi:hypothetical protein
MKWAIAKILTLHITGPRESLTILYPKETINSMKNDNALRAALSIETEFDVVSRHISTSKII